MRRNWLKRRAHETYRHVKRCMYGWLVALVLSSGRQFHFQIACTLGTVEQVHFQPLSCISFMEISNSDNRFEYRFEKMEKLRHFDEIFIVFMKLIAFFALSMAISAAILSVF